MPRDSLKEQPVVVTDRYTVLPRRNESVIPLSETDQERLLSMISHIDDGHNWWEIGLGIFAGAAITLWATYYVLPANTSLSTQKWYFGLAIGTSAFAIACIVGMATKKHSTKTSKDAVIEEFARIERQFERRKEKDDQANDSGQAPEFVIIQATYGTTTHHIDVTGVLNDHISNDRLELKASNTIAGDPAEGVVKSLEIKYRYGNEIKTVVYPEDSNVSLP